MLRFIPSLRLQPRRIQTITSYTRWSASAVVLRPTDAYVQKKQIQPFDRQKFRFDGDCRQRVVARIISKLPDLPLQPNGISEMAESFTKVILDAVEAEVPPPPRRKHKLVRCETAETSEALTIAWNAMEDARRFMRVNPRDRTAWKTLRTACANLRAVIDAGLHAYFE